MWVEGVRCQKFQSAGRLGRLFEVSQVLDEDAQDPVDEDKDIQCAVEISLTQATAALEKADEDAQARIKSDDDQHVF
ncbi:hypothetical protein GQ44DRAFT_720811, partial [Phaeosphaeriaceae sp. PMI808]